MKNNTNLEEENEKEDFKMEKILDNNIKHKYMLRICLIGNICVGKTSLLARYSDDYFKQIYSATIGVDFRVITLKYKDIVAKVHIWDTAGEERYKSITINYYRSSFLFSLSNLPTSSILIFKSKVISPSPVNILFTLISFLVKVPVLSVQI